MNYYAINEDAARRAKDANSFYDYRPGSATANYQDMVDEAAKIATRQKSRVDSMYHEKIDALLDKYARELADVINQRNEIDARVPSILITGGGNFPVRKKEKQNAARDKNDERYRAVQNILRHIQSTGMSGISSDDKDALPKLRAKLEALERHQEWMKQMNAYYRKHDTLIGHPDVGESICKELEANMLRHHNRAPFPGWTLSNNSANIRRIKGRIAELEREAQRAADNPDTETSGEGYRLVENTSIMRIQFLFDEKPDADTRKLLKEYGFRWAPSQGAWQRMLNDNGRHAAAAVQAVLD